MVRSTKRQRGQGMTEYIILVGMIALLLIFAITKYKDQVQITIEGSGDALRTNLDTMNAGETVEGRDDRGNKVTFTKTTGTHSDGAPIFDGSDGKKYINAGGSWQPI